MTDRTLKPGQPYKPPLPHPNKIIPKITLLICALFVFGNLFWRLGDLKEEVPQPKRVSLVHVDSGVDPFDLLRSGMVLVSPLELSKLPAADRIDFPMGSEAGALTYNAQRFGRNDHLGEDLNGIGGQNSDLGDKIYAAAAGNVIYRGEPSSDWGNVVILQHRDEDGKLFQTFYAHLDWIAVGIGDRVHRGQKLGTVGNADGRYLAHLHFEWRKGASLDIGRGYSPFSRNRADAEKALMELRGAPVDRLNRAVEAVHREELAPPPGALQLRESDVDSGPGREVP
ncbi:MAG: hypothetical protein ACI8UO_000114 [Verrucomicrobiales bacterium]|jgi:hypothetical protein